MKLETARRRAELKALDYGRYAIAKETQTEDAWVFSLGDPSGKCVTANLPMFVFDKEGDGTRDVYLPSREGFAILKDERPV